MKINDYGTTVHIRIGGISFVIPVKVFNIRNIFKITNASAVTGMIVRNDKQVIANFTITKYKRSIKMILIPNRTALGVVFGTYDYKSQIRGISNPNLIVHVIKAFDQLRLGNASATEPKVVVKMINWVAKYRQQQISKKDIANVI